MNVGIDLDKTDKILDEEYKFSDLKVSPYLGIKLDSLIKERNLYIRRINFSHYVFFSPNHTGNELPVLTEAKFSISR